MNDEDEEDEEISFDATTMEMREINMMRMLLIARRYVYGDGTTVYIQPVGDGTLSLYPLHRRSWRELGGFGTSRLY